METKPDIVAQLFLQKELVKDFSKILSAGYDLDKLLGHFLYILEQLLKVSRIAILVQEDSCFKVKACRGIPHDRSSQVSFPVKEGLIGYLIEEGTAVRIDSAKLIDIGMVQQFRMLGVTTAVPVWEHGTLKAVIVFNNKITGANVTDEELELVFALGSQLAVAIENAGLVEVISKQRKYLENVLANVSSAVVSVDVNEIITTYNAKAEEILGISSACVIGKSINLLPDDFVVLIKETIRTGKEIYRKELKLQGLLKFVGVSVSAIRNEKRDTDGAVMIFTDLSPIKALEEERRRNDKLDFVNTVAMRSSHELKNCLVSIKTFAQLLPERYADKQFREDFYLVVNKEVDRLNQMVENLLFFAQPFKVDISSTDIEVLVDETVDFLNKEGITEGIGIIKDFKHTSRFVKIDKTAVKKVLIHLLQNSIYAMPKGGSIYIMTEDVSVNGRAFLEIRIKDEGVGIPDEIIDKIWEPFFTTRTRGVGLGLTIVRKIVEAHGGTISAVGRYSAEKGAEIVISFPQEQLIKTGERLYFPSGKAVIV